MDPIEEYKQTEEYIQKLTELRGRTTNDLIELHKKYPYIKIDDLLDVYYTGMKRTVQEVTTKEE